MLTGQAASLAFMAAVTEEERVPVSGTARAGPSARFGSHGCLSNLLLGVHDERAVGADRLLDRRAHQACVAKGQRNRPASRRPLSVVRLDDA